MLSKLTVWLLVCGYFYIFNTNRASGTRAISVYEHRRRCPNSEENWRERADRYFCNVPTQYHCMLTEDGNLVEFCAEIIWIEEDYCPVFNIKTGSIDVSLCPENADCPRGHYLSNTVYKHPECLQRKVHSTSTTPTTVNTRTLKRLGGSYDTLQNSRNTCEASVDITPIYRPILACVVISMICTVISFAHLLLYVRKINDKACRQHDMKKEKP